MLCFSLFFCITTCLSKRIAGSSADILYNWILKNGNRTGLTKERVQGALIELCDLKLAMNKKKRVMALFDGTHGHMSLTSSGMKLLESTSNDTLLEDAMKGTLE
jgi:hypothetical protein